MHINLLTLLLPTLVLAGPGNRGLLFRRQATCSDSSEAVCEEHCMPVGSVCCNDGSSTFCPSGDTCIPGGCCPIGTTCSGGGGTSTIIDPATVIRPNSASTSSAMETTSTTGNPGSSSSVNSNGPTATTQSATTTSNAAIDGHPINSQLCAAMILGAIGQLVLAN